MDSVSLLFFSVLTVGIASPKQDAQKALFDAYMRHTHIEDNVEKRADKLRRDVVSDEARFYLGYAGYIGKTVIDKRIVFTWRF